MRTARQRLGRTGERLAADELTRRGLTVVDRNWRCQAGEIDLIVRDGECLAIVEVRTRRGQECGTPEESITSVKRERLIALAQAYVAAVNWQGPWRIDVVAVEMDGTGRLLRVTHLPSAVEG